MFLIGKKMGNKFCVIGLGFFGEHLVKNLSRQGAEVVAIDREADALRKVKDYVAAAVAVDSTNEKEMLGMGLQEVEAAIVAIGDKFEISLVTTAILKQKIGVKRVIARVLNPLHAQLLQALGVSEMLVPEAEAADHLAKRLMLPGILESFRISNEHCIFEINVPQWMIGRSIGELQLRQKFGMNIVTLKRKQTAPGINLRGKNDEYIVLGTLRPDLIFTDEDRLVLFGQEKDFQNFMKF